MKEPGTHKLTEAMKDQEAAPADANNIEGGRPQPTPAELREEARRKQEVGDGHPPSRDDRLTGIGRGDQTHG